MQPCYIASPVPTLQFEDSERNMNKETKSLSERIESSRHYSDINKIFRNEFATDADRGEYCRALKETFDQKSGNPHTIETILNKYQVCSVDQARRYRLLLARKTAKKFFIEDSRYSNITVRKIDEVTPARYAEVFSGREPVKSGPNAYWYTIAEWLVMLKVPTSPPMPKLIEDFLNRED